jgi:predicted AlkP superfamily phosphohydrolase/phosphomutase
MRRLTGDRGALLLLMALAILALAAPPRGDGPLLGYIGPGAGFAFLGSFLSLIAGFFLSVFSFLLWPLRTFWRLIRRRQGFRHARIRKLIFLGLDGLDPRLTERFMAEGKLPNFSRLKASGDFRRLRTTFPSLSPVAWSTFATGVNPARHNIFDFLNRNLKSYVPELSSTRVHKPRRILKLGRWRIPLSRPYVEMRRKSQTFWKLLGDQHIGSTIIRVPITFPPEKFNGRLLSAMCTPDLKGTQGSFSFFSTLVQQTSYEGGSRYPLERAGSDITGTIEGPEDSLHEGGGLLKVRFRIRSAAEPGGAVLHIGHEHWKLRVGEYSPWIRLTFRGGLGIKVNGIVRFLLNQLEPEVSLYMTPIEIDPEKAALPISHPGFYAAYLARMLGTFATLGMAEDTWALNEGVLDEDAFLKQAWAILAEREAMFVNALERTRRGVVACVFDTSDRVQHMFYRDFEQEASSPTAYSKTIEQLYQRMDRLVAKALEFVDDGTVLFVLSDHGFCSFRRGVDVNAWLRQHGYLVLKDGAATTGPYFQGVDWTRTRAYALGLGGLYLNMKARESQGIVSPGAEAEQLKQEIVQGLAGLPDPQHDAEAIRAVYCTSAIYRGPYADAAPDLIVGYNEGYRTSWDAAVGKVNRDVFEDNTKAWSGDHCVDPLLVPGVLFCNRKLDSDDPGIEDLAPTALALFGLDPPAWMEGKPVFRFS